MKGRLVPITKYTNIESKAIEEWIEHRHCELNVTKMAGTIDAL